MKLLLLLLILTSLLYGSDRLAVWFLGKAEDEDESNNHRDK